MTLPRSIYLIILLTLLISFQARSQETPNLRGQVTDQQSALIANADIILTDANHVKRIEITDKNGNFRFRNLPNGIYVLQVRKSGFAVYENRHIEIGSSSHISLTIVLVIEERRETIEVPSDSTSSDTDPATNKDSNVFKGPELEGLPDDPEALDAALKLLAGTEAGPDGGQIYIDGFRSRNIPPKASIKEIRINRNPFSAEFDRIGSGRIEIITKAGSNELEGSFFFRFNNDALNARNPFVSQRQPFQAFRQGGNISGPFLNKKGSFFVDIDSRKVVDTKIVIASVLNSLFQIVPFRETVRSPEHAAFLNVRTDMQINENSTLSTRYGMSVNYNKNLGVGGFAMPSQAYDSSNVSQTFQLAQTSVVNQEIINEIRFQYENTSRQNTVETDLATIVVSEAFVDGGSSVGANRFTERRWELKDDITLSPEGHTIRLGLQLNGTILKDHSASGFNGTFVYAGGLAPILENGQIRIDANGEPVLESISSIERYRRTLFFRQLGYSLSEIRSLGGGSSQFTINGGNPDATISQLSFSGYVQDDWRVTHDFGLSVGIRFEAQNNIDHNIDFAPRIGFAWVSKRTGKKKRATVIRGGFGIFYSRFGENLVLDAEKFDGNHVWRYTITDRDILDSFNGVPSVLDLAELGQPLTVRRISSELRVPYSFHGAISAEQELPFNTVLTVTFNDVKVRNALRSRNINAPFSSGGSRPFPGAGDIYQYESTGRFDSQRLIFNLTTRFWRFSSLSIKYDLGRAKSNTDGPTSFPVNQFDLSGEYGRSILDSRHKFILSGYFNAPLGIRFLPLVVAVSGRPFDITLGQDVNGDGIFNERPAFAFDLSRPHIVQTKFGVFDLDPTEDSVTIPRNYGTGSPFFAVGLRASRTFRFNLWNDHTNTNSQMSATKRFGLNLSAQFWNLFNRPNLGLPIGNLTSPFFGQATATAGGPGSGDPLSGSRTVEFQIQFSF